MRVCVFDVETNIDEEKGTYARNPDIDIYTVIYGNHPDKIQVEHKAEGYGRLVPSVIFDSDVLVGHNLLFDLGFCVHKTSPSRKMFIDFLLAGGTIWDTQYAEYLLSGQRHLFAALAELQEIYLGEKEKLSRISSLYKKGMGADHIVQSGMKRRLLWTQYNKYCKSDGSSTLRIFSKQYKRAKQEGMLPIIKLYMQFLTSLIFMQYTGIVLDMQKLEETHREFKLKEVQLLQEAQQLVKHLWTDERLPELIISKDRINSAILFGGTIPCHVRRQIGIYKNGNPHFKKMREQVYVEGFALPTSLTEKISKGWYKTDEAVLLKVKKYTDNQDVINYVDKRLEAISYRKMANTYLQAFLEKNVDGVLYPNFNHCKVVTGRLSAEAPNFQNLPSSGPMSIAIEGQMIAPPGYVCVSCDYNALEAWVAAWLSDDEQLLKDLQSLDIHCVTVGYLRPEYTYEQIYDFCKVQELPEWDHLRFRAKGIRYGREYGRGLKALAADTGLSEEEVKLIFEKEDARYPKKAYYNKYMVEFAQQHRQLCMRKHYPSYMVKETGKDGKRFQGDLELLPIYLPDGTREFRENEFRQFGWYRTKTGRKYTFDEYGQIWYGKFKKGVRPTECMNYKCQGTGNDIMAAACAELLQYQLSHPRDMYMVSTVHDSMKFYVKKDKLNLTCKAIVDIMSSARYLPVPLGFKIPIDVKVGECFSGELMQKWKE
jgi:DNA polymerase I-like protein with 3'-5' exonuclease and polymerase domains